MPVPIADTLETLGPYPAVESSDIGGEIVKTVARAGNVVSFGYDDSNGDPQSLSVVVNVGAIYVPASGVSSVGTDHYELTSTEIPVPLTSGTIIDFAATADNTGSVQLRINGTDYVVRKANGPAFANLEGGDWPDNLNVRVTLYGSVLYWTGGTAGNVLIRNTGVNAGDVPLIGSDGVLNPVVSPFPVFTVALNQQVSSRVFMGTASPIVFPAAPRTGSFLILQFPAALDRTQDRAAAELSIHGQLFDLLDDRGRQLRLEDVQDGVTLIMVYGGSQWRLASHFERGGADESGIRTISPEYTINITASTPDTSVGNIIGSIFETTTHDFVLRLVTVIVHPTVTGAYDIGFCRVTRVSDIEYQRSEAISWVGAAANVGANMDSTLRGDWAYTVEPTSGQYFAVLIRNSSGDAAPLSLMGAMEVSPTFDAFRFVAKALFATTDPTLTDNLYDAGDSIARMALDFEVQIDDTIEIQHGGSHVVSQPEAINFDGIDFDVSVTNKIVTISTTGIGGVSARYYPISDANVGGIVNAITLTTGDNLRELRERLHVLLPRGLGQHGVRHDRRRWHWKSHPTTLRRHRDRY